MDWAGRASAEHWVGRPSTEDWAWRWWNNRNTRTSAAWRPRKNGIFTGRASGGFVCERIRNLVSSSPALRLRKNEACSRGRPLAEEWEDQVAQV
uniref:Uncharacterized protein n=1 Tax=Cucumis melo TaxID=3656 RepID=A0A9I9CG25_CUCME